jgi:hypothetical protein
MTPTRVTSFDRRQLLRLVGASAALAVVSGSDACTTRSRSASVSSSTRQPMSRSTAGIRAIQLYSLRNLTTGAPPAHQPLPSLAV